MKMMKIPVYTKKHERVMKRSDQIKHHRPAAMIIPSHPLRPYLEMPTELMVTTQSHDIKQSLKNQRGVGCAGGNELLPCVGISCLLVNDLAAFAIFLVGNTQCCCCAVLKKVLLREVYIEFEFVCPEGDVMQSELDYMLVVRFLW